MQLLASNMSQALGPCGWEMLGYCELGLRSVHSVLVGHAANPAAESRRPESRSSEVSECQIKGGFNILVRELCHQRCEGRYSR